MEPRLSGEPRPDSHTLEHEELAALYALEALGHPERAHFEQHLGACQQCAWILRQDRETLGALAELAGLEPSPGFRERLMARAAALARLRTH